MLLLDSNVIIYSALPENAFLKDLLTGNGVFVSAVSKVEVLGFSGLGKMQKEYFEAVFRSLLQLPIDAEIVDCATLLRQSRRMTLGDALIAATVLIHNLELVTRNLADFKGIQGLKLRDPFAKCSS